MGMVNEVEKGVWRNWQVCHWRRRWRRRWKMETTEKATAVEATEVEVVGSERGAGGDAEDVSDVLELDVLLALGRV